MIILGINGWYTRSHDASACLVKDGEILAMAEEARKTSVETELVNHLFSSVSFSLK